MAKTTRTDQAKLALQQLMRDEEVQAHLRTAAIRLREASQRVARRPWSKAVEDKNLYAKIREAATSLARAAKLLGPEPEPPKHRGRKLVLIAAAGGVAVVVIKKRRDATVQAQEVPAAPPAPPTPAPDPQHTAA